MERINFKQIRTLGEIIQDAGKFIRQNFGNIVKMSLLWVIVPIVITAVFMTITFKNFFPEMMEANMYGSSNPFLVYTKMMWGYILMGIAMLLLHIIMISYIRLYAEGVSEITMKDIVADIKKHFLTVLLSGIVLGIVISIGFVLCLLPGIYLSVVLAPFFFVLIIEKKSFGNAWKRCFYLIKGEWWNTFGLYLVTLLINMAMYAIVIVPMYVFMIVKAVTGAQESMGNPDAMIESMSGVSWFIPLGYIFSYITNIILITVIAFKYYSLVEQKDGTGEKEAIENLGN